MITVAEVAQLDPMTMLLAVMQMTLLQYTMALLQSQVREHDRIAQDEK